MNKYDTFGPTEKSTRCSVCTTRPQPSLCANHTMWHTFESSSGPLRFAILTEITFSHSFRFRCQTIRKKKFIFGSKRMEMVKGDNDKFSTTFWFVCFRMASILGVKCICCCPFTIIPMKNGIQRKMKTYFCVSVYLQWKWSCLFSRNGNSVLFCHSIANWTVTVSVINQIYCSRATKYSFRFQFKFTSCQKWLVITFQCVKKQPLMCQIDVCTTFIFQDKKRNKNSNECL